MSVSVDVQRRLGALAAVWDALVDITPHATVFLRSWWLDATATDSTEFVIVSRDGTFIGGLGLERSRRHGVDRYQLAGLPNPHGVDAIASPGEAGVVAEALRGWFARPGSRMFDLEGPPPDSLVARAAPRRVRVEELERAPFITLDGDFEHYLAKRSRHRRQDIRRVLRRLAERNVTYRVAPPNEISHSLEALARTHDRRWGARSVFLGDFDRFAHAAEIGVKLGVVTFHEVVHGDQVVASLVTIDHADVCSFCQTGRDAGSELSQSSGTLLKARAIEGAVERGARIVDLCYGDPRTKREWADDAVPVVALRWSVGVRGYAVRALRNTVGAAIRRLRTRRQPVENEAGTDSGSGATPPGESASTAKSAM